MKKAYIAAQGAEGAQEGKRVDYASVEHMDAWLRHPVLGDPSFDTFERREASVHISEPPYEWSVNGYLYRDHDGTRYFYAGLYPYGYASTHVTPFLMYRSTDKGETWEKLGIGFPEGFTFEGDNVPSDSAPDVFMTYDRRLGKYLLTYDTATNNASWETFTDPNSPAECGAALALGDTPAGPFTRLPRRFVTNRDIWGKLGRFTRLYASCVVPRERDYIAFCLADSGSHFSWGLSVLTAPTVNGPWSDPHMVLSCDRSDYYPCPMEYFPVEVRGDRVVAHATSVAKNRNYQMAFAAPLEQAHDPAAWEMIKDGNVWHAHDHPDEYEGIWGQTLHGFEEDGVYTILHASRNTEDRGTLGIATRPADTPYSDGFTLTGHGGPSISPLKASYGAFALTAELTHKGTVDLIFGYDGVLGPDANRSDSIPHPDALTGYHALRISGCRCTLLTAEKNGEVRIHAEAEVKTPVTSVKLVRRDTGEVSAWANGEALCADVPLSSEVAPLAISVGARSRLDCTRFEVEGQPYPYEWHWNPADALLGAGQLYPDPAVVTPDAPLAPDRWHHLSDGYVGEGEIAAKWNLHGRSFTVRLKKDLGFGKAAILLDGQPCAEVDLRGEGEAHVTVTAAAQGAHAVTVKPVAGRIAILGCIVRGTVQGDLPQA